MAIIDLVLAQLCIAINIVVGKYLVSYIPVLILLLLRFFLGAVGMYLFCYFRNKSIRYEVKTKYDKKVWILLFLQAMCGGFLFNVFILWGMHYTSATVAGIINSLIPALITLLSFLILKEKLTKNRLLAILIAVVGLIIMTTPKLVKENQSSSLLGILIITLSLFPEAMFTILAKMFKVKHSPYISTFFINVMNMFVIIPSIFIGYKLNIDSHNVLSLTNVQISLVFLYALTGGILFFVFWYRGVEQVSASHAGLFTALMPIFTTILAYLLLNESITVPEIIGSACILMSIVLGSKLKSEKNISKGCNDEVRELL